MPQTPTSFVTEHQELVDRLRGTYPELDQTWLAHSWEAVSASGLDSDGFDDEELDYPRRVIGLCALSLFYARFESMLVSANREVSEVPDILGSDRPWVSEIELGRYCERHRIQAGILPETAYDLLEAAVLDLVPAVRSALVDHLGQTTLFVSLVQASRNEFSVDVSGTPTSMTPAAVDDVVNRADPDLHSAFEWLA